MHRQYIFIPSHLGLSSICQETRFGNLKLFSQISPGLSQYNKSGLEKPHYGLLDVGTSQEVSQKQEGLQESEDLSSHSHSAFIKLCDLGSLPDHF